MDEMTLKQALGASQRSVLWEQTKGNFQAMLATFINQHDRFVKLEKTIHNFVIHVESDGMQE